MSHCSLRQTGLVVCRRDTLSCQAKREQRLRCSTCKYWHIAQVVGMFLQSGAAVPTPNELFTGMRQT